MNTHSSKLLTDAVDAFSTLPGIGRKTALRLTLHLLNQDVSATTKIANAISTMRNHIKRCERCNHISDQNFCSICEQKSRNNGTLCIVESIRDVLAIEETSQYNGSYHVLGGLISPLDGVGPDQLFLDNLNDRIQKEHIQEVIMALSPTVDGDTTTYYLSRILKGQGVKISLIARGISFGGELEYADEVTLGRSILARTLYQLPDQA